MRRLPHPIRAVRGLFAALLTALAVIAALVTATAPAQADTTICEPYGTTTIQGRYVVQNNRWGSSSPQCVTATDTGFRLTQADGSVPTNGAPKSYPSVFNGCHYTNCSPGTKLPARISGISSAPSSISYGYVGGAVYNASYDIWLDPTPRTDGVNRTEIMIWFNKVGPIQPIGSQVGTATVGGRTWQVWSGGNGSNDVLSFVAPSAIESWSFDVMDFVRETVARGMARNDWYLTSVQAGFEPWQNGAGLAVNSFSSTVDTGGGTPGGPGTPAACTVSYATNVWPGGFTANVTVRNTGSSAVDGWRLAFALPAGQRV
uniref:GH12 family glycosyl hydrolase domain-containing protein n=1 Tax=Streptomyces viridosporus TaxID=67581 RepID=UPI0009BEB97E